jgi:hypothetical protein
MDAQSETRVALPSKIITDDEHLDSTTSPIIVTLHRPQPSFTSMVHPLQPQRGERETANSTPNVRRIADIRNGRRQGDTAKTTLANCRPKRLTTCKVPMANAKTAFNTRTRYAAKRTHKVSNCQKIVGYPKTAVNGRRSTAETTREVSDAEEVTRVQVSDIAETTREISSNSSYDLPLTFPPKQHRNRSVAKE